MTSHVSITYPIKAATWQALPARVEKSVGVFRPAGMRNRVPLPGCFSMTD
jgi:hypothetical protein